MFCTREFIILNFHRCWKPKHLVIYWENNTAVNFFVRKNVHVSWMLFAKLRAETSVVSESCDSHLAHWKTSYFSLLFRHFKFICCWLLIEGNKNICKWYLCNWIFFLDLMTYSLLLQISVVHMTLPSLAFVGSLRGLSKLGID